MHQVVVRDSLVQVLIVETVAVVVVVYVLQPLERVVMENLQITEMEHNHLIQLADQLDLVVMEL